MRKFSFSRVTNDVDYNLHRTTVQVVVLRFKHWFRTNHLFRISNNIYLAQCVKTCPPRSAPVIIPTNDALGVEHRPWLLDHPSLMRLIRRVTPIKRWSRSSLGVQLVKPFYLPFTNDTALETNVREALQLSRVCVCVWVWEGRSAGVCYR